MAPEQSFQALQSLVQQFAGKTATQKAVLLLQPSAFQGQVWQAALTSQGIAVFWEMNPIDPASLLDQIQAAGIELPLALILDVTVLNSNPYAFCRWCRERYPLVKVILTNANAREISPPEHHWATYQGAQDLLPGFRTEALATSVPPALTRVLAALGWRSLQPEALNTALVPFLGTAKPAPVIAPPPPRPQPLPPPPITPPAGAAPTPPPPQSKPAEEAPRKTYRGIAL